MSVCVRFPALFADRIDGVDRIDVSARNVEGALRTLGERYPKLRTLIFAANGQINPVMVVFLNDQQLSTEQLQSVVQAGDEIEIVPAIEGGSGRRDTSGL